MTSPGDADLFNATTASFEWLNGIQPLERWEYYCTAVYLTIVGTIATVGNSLVATVLILVLRRRKPPARVDPISTLLLNLAISDLGISLFGYPFTTAAGYAGRWLIGRAGCTLAGFMCTTFALTDMNTLLAIAVFRYIILCKPHLKGYLSSPMVLYSVVASCWIYSLAWAFLALGAWTTYDFEPFGTSCSINWDGRSAGDISYSVLMTIGCYMVHVVVMGYCYYHISRMSRRVHVTLRSNRPVTIQEAIEIQKFIESRTTVMVWVMMLTFTLAWSPYAWVVFWAIISPGTLPMWLNTFPTMFAKSTCAMNPFIYMIGSAGFIQKAKSVLCPKKVKDTKEVTQMYTIRSDPRMDEQRVPVEIIQSPPSDDDGEQQGLLQRIGSVELTASGMLRVDRTHEGVYIGENIVNVPGSPWSMGTSVARSSASATNITSIF